MPIFTGKTTNAGRPLWQPTAEEAQKYGIDPQKPYSEISRTIPVSIDEQGRPAPGTKWVNVPSVFDGGKIMDNEDFLQKFYSENQYKDPITNRKLEFFDDVKSAEKSAQSRSDGLLN